MRFQQIIFFFALIFAFLAHSFLFSLLMPIFQNPDEQAHYATIQTWSSPEKLTSKISKEPGEINPENINTYRFTEEITETAVRTKFDEVKFQPQNTYLFLSSSFTGFLENDIRNSHWIRTPEFSNNSTLSTKSWYYLIGSWIERSLADQDIFTRMLAIRLFSVLLGLLIVFLAYLTLHKIGFSRIESTLIAGLIAFQPMLGITAAQINIDIALIFAFALFTYAGVSLLEARGKQSVFFGILALAAAILGITAKGPGIVLIGALIPLLGYACWTRYREAIFRLISASGISPKAFWVSSFLFVVLIGWISASLVPTSYWTTITRTASESQFDSPFHSLSAYIDKTIDIDAFRSSSLSYWGNFGWLDTSIHDSVFNLIWTIEIIAMIGLILYLIPWRPKRFPAYLSGIRDFLPAKRSIIALLLLSLALELAIRFYDWRTFDVYAKILIGTPGRYFLPNIVAHFALLATGLGFFCRSRVQFHWLLKILLVLMLLLSSYSLFDIILPRYYL